MGHSAAKSKVPEEASGDADRQAAKARWQSENSAFIAAYNQVVEEEGLPLEAWRMF